MSSWSDQFGKGGVLESKDGATYDLKEINDPKAPKYDDTMIENVPSLAEQLAERRAEEEEEYRQRHRNLPPKPLDEEEAFFLEAIQTQEQIKEDLKHKQAQKDIDAFNKAVQNRVIKLNDSNGIKTINDQINSENMESQTKKSSKDIVIAPSVHRNDEPKIDLDAVVLLKRKKVKKKKKKKQKSNKIKKRKLKDLDKSRQNAETIKRRKLNSESTINTHKLSEWERD